MGSLERADGFAKIVHSLQKKIKYLRREESVKVKRNLIRDLETELQLYRGMYLAELDMYNGDLERPPRKFLLTDDGFTFRLNPEYIHVDEEI